MALPEDAAAAAYAGGVALRWGRLNRAETWLRRAIALGRRCLDWQAYAQACLDLGTVYALRGMPEQARWYLWTSARTGKRHAYRCIRAAALHELMRMAVEAGQLEDADRLARAAASGFRKDHPSRPELLHDIAYLWVQLGRFAKAIPLLQQLLGVRSGPGDRALTFAVLARAAAGQGDRGLYEESWTSAWLIIRSSPSARHRRALLELGRASSVVRDWRHVQQAAGLISTLPKPAQPTDRFADQLDELLRRYDDPAADSPTP